MFPINLRNCYALTVEGKSKTTNSLEAWHNSLKLTLASADGKKPRFWKWPRKMKQECSMMEAQLILLLGIPKKLNLEDQRIALKRKEFQNITSAKESLNML
uniref:Uncharacterized protein n=1 Tax=Ditylenchus dipsaci TaxID=166011 RepID=A0A915DYK4_9BILA